MSAGELRNVAARVGGFEALIDRAGKRYVDKGLKYAAPTGPRIEQILIADPLLLKTPIVRAGNRATVGYVPDVWQSWIDEAKNGLGSMAVMRGAAISILLAAVLSAGCAAVLVRAGDEYQPQSAYIYGRFLLDPEDNQAMAFSIRCRDGKRYKIVFSKQEDEALRMIRLPAGVASSTTWSTRAWARSGRCRHFASWRTSISSRAACTTSAISARAPAARSRD